MVRLNPLKQRPSQQGARPVSARPAVPSAARTDSFRAVVAPTKRVVELSLEKLRPRGGAGGRQVSDALRDADEILRGPALDRASEGTAEVTRDAASVHDRRDTLEKDPRHQGALAQLEANAPLEAAALGRLSPTARAQYEAVKARCLEAKDPVAALALQKLVLSGRLPGDRDLAGGDTTLGHLSALADEATPLAEGIDRGQLVTDLVQELATPSSIGQGQRGTCAPTTLAIQLALHEPAEYARIVAGLAGPSGEARLAGGQTVSREAGSIEADTTNRAITQRLLGGALMELGNGDRDFVDDTGEGAGAWSDKLDVLYEALTGRPMSERRLTTDAQRAAAMGIVDTQLRAGVEVPVALSWGEGFHKVLVTGTTTIDGVEYVEYINPWGREERIPRADFQQRLADISYDPRAQVRGTVLEGLDVVKEGLDRITDGMKGVFDRLDPKDLLLDVRAAQVRSIKL